MTSARKIGVLALVMIGMLQLGSTLSGQTRKTMLVTDRKGTLVELTPWAVRPSGELEVEKGKSKASFSWDKIRKIEIDQAVTAAQHSCSIKITPVQGAAVAAQIGYSSRFLEGRVKDGRQYSIDLCLAKTISFKD